MTECIHPRCIRDRRRSYQRVFVVGGRHRRRGTRFRHIPLAGRELLAAALPLPAILRQAQDERQPCMVSLSNHETDDPHRAQTFRADQRIYFAYLLNQPGPTFPESLFVSLRFDDAGDGVIHAFLLAFSPRDVAVVSVISNVLFRRLFLIHICIIN